MQCFGTSVKLLPYRRYKLNKEQSKYLMMMANCAESRNDGPEESY